MPDIPRDPEGSDADDDAVLAALRAHGRVSSPADHEWDAPPADLWERISAEAFPTGPALLADAEGPETTDAEVRPLAPRRPSRGPAPWLLAAAAAAVLVIAAGVVLFQQRGTDPTVLAAAPLDRLGDAGTGTAELVERDGVLQLRVDTDGLDAGDGFVEVWVIDPDVTKLVSLGPLRDDGLYDLPPGLDPESFPVVDVSVEPLDGDPTHSGDSRLRGTLEF